MKMDVINAVRPFAARAATHVLMIDISQFVKVSAAEHAVGLHKRRG